MKLKEQKISELSQQIIQLNIQIKDNNNKNNILISENESLTKQLNELSYKLKSVEDLKNTLYYQMKEQNNKSYNLSIEN